MEVLHMKISVVIPAFNEAGKISRDIGEAARFAEKHREYEWEFLIVDDGSKDDTAKQARIAADRVGGAHFEVLQYGKNRGKGYAVRYGIQQATGEIVGFVDAGLCVPFHYIIDAVKMIQSGHDLAIASRRLRLARIVQAQPLYRRLGSRVFGSVARKLMGVKVTDTQCGFKFYSAAASREIYSRVKTDGFMFDIEALLIARQLDFRCGEFAVEWSNDSDTRYHPVTGTMRNFRELLQIRLRTLFA